MLVLIKDFQVRFTLKDPLQSGTTAGPASILCNAEHAQLLPGVGERMYRQPFRRIERFAVTHILCPIRFDLCGRLNEGLRALNSAIIDTSQRLK